jgi:hypothetical protein
MALSWSPPGTTATTGVIATLISFAYHLILVGCGYLPVVELIRKSGVRVEVWARQRTLSAELKYAADAVCFIDDFVIEGPASAIPRRHYPSFRGGRSTNRGAA